MTFDAVYKLISYEKNSGKICLSPSFCKKIIDIQNNAQNHN